MGFFGKIKNILFEDEEEDDIGGMPVYTKDDVKVSNKKEFHDETEEIELPPIRANANTRFKNVKRDIDFDENDVLGEVPGHSDIDKKIEKEEKTSLKESSLNDSQKSSPFLTFDEDEFERLNAHPSRNDRPKKEIRNIGVPVNNNVNIARQANGNFSSTTAPTTNESKRSEGSRYNINGGTLINGKKPFTPSPVLSPVYGILDKNYKKDDIVDKQGGLKREKSNKPVIPQIDDANTATLYEVNIDNVRKKAYGELEELEQSLNLDIPKLDESKIDSNSSLLKEEPLEEIKVPTIEEELEEKYIPNIASEEISDVKTNSLDEVVEESLEEKVNTETKKSKLLDELEKTSTLQILDDIEKELNSIKPISHRDEEIDYNKEEKEKSDTLENDLFHLIDSMYQEGEEEEND